MKILSKDTAEIEYLLYIQLGFLKKVKKKMRDDTQQEILI